MFYQFKNYPYLKYLLIDHGEKIQLQCGFHIIPMTRVEFGGLLAIGLLDRIAKNKRV